DRAECPLVARDQEADLGIVAFGDGEGTAVGQGRFVATEEVAAIAARGGLALAMSDDGALVPGPDPEHGLGREMRGGEPAARAVVEAPLAKIGQRKRDEKTG